MTPTVNEMTPDINGISDICINNQLLMIRVYHYSVTYVRGDRGIPDIRVVSANAKLYLLESPKCVFTIN